MAAELTIASLRASIDAVDELLVRLLDLRARCAVAVGRCKQRQALPVYEPQREATVIARVRAINAALQGPLDDAAIDRLYERIIDEARRIQRIESAVEGTRPTVKASPSGPADTGAPSVVAVETPATVEASPAGLADADATSVVAGEVRASRATIEEE